MGSVLTLGRTAIVTLKVQWKYEFDAKKWEKKKQLCTSKDAILKPFSHYTRFIAANITLLCFPMRPTRSGAKTNKQKRIRYIQTGKQCVVWDEPIRNTKRSCPVASPFRMSQKQAII